MTNKAPVCPKCGCFMSADSKYCVKCGYNKDQPLYDNDIPEILRDIFAQKNNKDK